MLITLIFDNFFFIISFVILVKNVQIKVVKETNGHVLQKAAAVLWLKQIFV